MSGDGTWYWKACKANVLLSSFMRSSETPKNIDPLTVKGFGDEWKRFDQRGASADELNDIFAQYFKLFPWERLSVNAVGFDAGCGSGRWAQFVLPRVHALHCIDASGEALEVAKRNLSGFRNAIFHHASVADMPIPNASMDFGYSLGVLHHVPDTQAGIQSCSAKLQPGAPFLLYLYYAFDSRPLWFRTLWRLSDRGRKWISRAPHWLRYHVCQFIAAVVYFPLARFAAIVEILGGNPGGLPLAAYRRRSFYTMRTDALDRFGTQLEQRFSATQIETMMRSAGFERISISDAPPYWCALGYKEATCAALPER
jgi:SAM-dependent methyltransferase